MEPCCHVASLDSSISARNDSIQTSTERHKLLSVFYSTLRLCIMNCLQSARATLACTLSDCRRGGLCRSRRLRLAAAAGLTDGRQLARTRLADLVKGEMQECMFPNVCHGLLSGHPVEPCGIGTGLVRMEISRYFLGLQNIVFLSFFCLFLLFHPLFTHGTLLFSNLVMSACF